MAADADPWPGAVDVSTEGEQDAALTEALSAVRRS
jgi:hypothetical protein